MILSYHCSSQYRRMADASRLLIDIAFIESFNIYLFIYLFKPPIWRNIYIHICDFYTNISQIRLYNNELKY